ncbi:Oidioi.mRNA.OKI2018_I69.chr2.g5242.t1.cds [Oikopleura dioica]|uniref:Oidioi.mRNA.OKI2018_I69.chr2.g5242.t1.cds n=1 Tax=Oikopleura dioica TaxID=34765 RepID=A0ABN7T452_OIKDI|nr:Oidioi.mRNA.OKI2018_I69.chr2.g5242.t1.cds [Oikopleura dioica]
MPSHLYKFVLPKAKTVDGLPEPCFELNNLSGRQLAYITASNLPKIGIHKFEDIKRLMQAFRSLTGDEYPNYHVSISENKNSDLVETWTRKARSGPAADAVRIEDVTRERVHQGTHKIPLRRANFLIVVCILIIIISLVNIIAFGTTFCSNTLTGLYWILVGLNFKSIPSANINSLYDLKLSLSYISLFSITGFYEVKNPNVPANNSSLQVKKYKKTHVVGPLTNIILFLVFQVQDDTPTKLFESYKLDYLAISFYIAECVLMLLECLAFYLIFLALKDFERIKTIAGWRSPTWLSGDLRIIENQGEQSQNNQAFQI